MNECIDNSKTLNQTKGEKTSFEFMKILIYKNVFLFMSLNDHLNELLSNN